MRGLISVDRHVFMPSGVTSVDRHGFESDDATSADELIRQILHLRKNIEKIIENVSIFDYGRP